MATFCLRDLSRLRIWDQQLKNTMYLYVDAPLPTTNATFPHFSPSSLPSDRRPIKYDRSRTKENLDGGRSASDLLSAKFLGERKDAKRYVRRTFFDVRYNYFARVALGSYTFWSTRLVEAWKNSGEETAAIDKSTKYGNGSVGYEFVSIVRANISYAKNGPRAEGPFDCLRDLISRRSRNETRNRL